MRLAYCLADQLELQRPLDVAETLKSFAAICACILMGAATFLAILWAFRRLNIL